MNKYAFIGMMGCGKTTISRKLAEDLSIKYISIDEEIEKQNGMSISKIFETHGENYFREAETATIKALAVQDDLVLDCGGGIILKDENISALKENGFQIIFLNRELEDILKDIDYESRPLLKENHDHIYKVYHERIDTYFKCADIVIDNTGMLEEKYAEIKRQLKLNI